MQYKHNSRHGGQTPPKLYDFKFPKRCHFQITVLWLMKPHSLTGNKCSETLISRYRIPEHESVAHIHLPGKCVSESRKTNEGWTYHKQYAPKRRQQCWLLSPTSILGCLLMMQNRGWLEFVHNKACQEQRKPPIGLMADPASSHMLVFPILCFMVQWSSTSNSLNETTI